MCTNTYSIYDLSTFPALAVTGEAGCADEWDEEFFSLAETASADEVRFKVVVSPCQYHGSYLQVACPANWCRRPASFRELFGSLPPALPVQACSVRTYCI